MAQTKARKEHERHDRAATAARQKEQEEIIALLVCGVDTLIAHANSADMGTAMRILYTAKEELVHWAVNMNFHESPQDKFINRHLYDNRLSTVESMILRAMKSMDTRAEMLALLNPPTLKSSPLIARK